MSTVRTQPQDGDDSRQEDLEKIADSDLPASYIAEILLEVVNN